MIAVFLELVIDGDYGSCDEGARVIRVRFTAMNVQIKSPVDMILSDSKHIADAKESNSSLGVSAQSEGIGRSVPLPRNN